MKKRFQIIMAVAVVILSFTWISCDKVENPYTEEVIITPNDTTTGNFDGIKKVLLEDYTAIRCINCPEAAAKAHELIENSGHRVISMEIHGGNLADPATENGVDFTTDFRTEAGKTYYNTYGISAQPVGIIDKVKNGNTNYFMVPNWTSTVESRLAEPYSVGIDLKSKIEENQLSLKVYYKAFTELTAGNYKLLLYFVQDSMISNQKNSKPNYGTVPVIYDYVHHNVLRGTISESAWGTDI
ncbi:MAG: Omp28-related outer membrane protein, partial [Bacteroidales bacterium]|nr:Omp28-related outer membrane protein [Bacteroidales bacterium]